MPITILMPALSPTMKEGKLAKWCKKEGDKVESGQVLAEVETDKATMEFESAEDGVLAKIIVEEGSSNVAVNSPIAILLEDGETEEDLKNFSPLGLDEQKSESSQVESSSSLDVQKDESNQKTLDPDQKARIVATPLAKKIAHQNNLDLTGKAGSGPRGRIVKQDVLDMIDVAEKKVEHSNFENNRTSYPENKIIEPSQMRKVIAQRLLESKQTVPHFYLSADCILDKLLDLRAQINQESELKITINDFIVKASALAIGDIPQMPHSWQDDKIIEFAGIDVSVAVAIEDGLVTPIVKNADQKTISQISCDVKDLAKRAKENRLSLQEFQGGCFTISNLGMYKIKEFYAIINPPQSAILAVGAARKIPVVVDDEIIINTVMTVTLSCDHRVVDGACGAQFLNKFKNYIENPLLIFV